MARKPSYFLSAGLLIWLWALPSSASLVTFSDSTFNSPDWSIITQTFGPGGSDSAVQVSSGGNPGAYRQVTVNVTGSSDSEVFAFNLKSGATYNPAAGAIISLTYAEDRNTTGQEYGPALLQGSNLYYAFAGAGPSSGWQSTTIAFVPGASTNDLLKSFHTSSSDTIHPDFSATGAPITFGFAAIDNSTSFSFTAVSGYDNWSISLTTAAVPEPAGVTLILMLAFVLLVRSPNRRSTPATYL